MVQVRDRSGTVSILWGRCRFRLRINFSMYFLFYKLWQFALAK